MSKKDKILLILTGILITLSSAYFFINHQKSVEISPPLTTPETRSNTKTVLIIDGVEYESEIAGVTSVYDFMSQLQNEGKIKFTEKNYIGIGKFISEINGIGGNGEKNWIYYVNGKEAKIGVSNYKIKPGDIVSWKYEKNY